MKRKEKTMTQEEKIKEIKRLLHIGDMDAEVKDSFVKDEQAKRILDWHTTELNRRMEDVIEYCDREIRNANYFLSMSTEQDHPMMGVFLARKRMAEDLKSLLNEKKQNENKRKEN